MTTGRLQASALALGLALLALGGCATLDPLGRRTELEDDQRRYTNFVRWGEVDTASRFVAPDAREAFEAMAPTLGAIRFTDYEASELEFADDGRSATVLVVYQGYRLSTAIERPLRETQHWTRDEEAGAWRVRSTWSPDAADGVAKRP